jgi:ornithine cyclodeaminase/alanine dehydrogenase-like protein (mu-crystallin family)
MTNSYGLAQIREALPGIDVVTAMEESFLAYSDGLAVVPPVGELLFEEPPGEVHIKYGYIRGEEYYVIKIASGFYENRKRNLPWAQGMMLLFRQETGEPVCILTSAASASSAPGCREECSWSTCVRWWPVAGWWSGAAARAAWKPTERR